MSKNRKFASMGAVRNLQAGYFFATLAMLIHQAGPVPTEKMARARKIAIAELQLSGTQARCAMHGDPVYAGSIDR